METRSVLAMSYILEDYKKLGSIILEAQKKTKNRDFSYDLLRVSLGKTVIGGNTTDRSLLEFLKPCHFKLDFFSEIIIWKFYKINHMGIK